MEQPAEALEPWDLSCPDWEDRMCRGQLPIADLPLDRTRAAQAVGVMKKLRIPDIAGTPTLGEAAGQWLFDLVAAIFGAYDAATRTRMIRQYFLMVPKKNGKTTIGAAIMLTAMVLNTRPRSEMLLTGPSHEVSEKAYSQAAGMVALDDEGYLQKRFKPRDHLKLIDDLRYRTKLKIKTFDESIVTGALPIAALVDEEHLLGAQPRAAAILGQLTGGMVGVPDAFLVKITTQSFRPPAGIFEADLKVARAIRDGRERGLKTLPILYEFTREQQKDREFWENQANWPRLHPNIGRSVQLPLLADDLADNRAKGDSSVQLWLSQHLNIEIGLALGDGHWVGADHWEGATIVLTLDDLLERSEVVVIGGDGGGLDDLLGFAVLGREKVTRKWLLWCRAWCYAGVLERRKSEATRLLDLQRAGDLSIVETLGDDMEELTAIARKVKASGKLPAKNAVGLDPAGIGGIVDALNLAGITAEQIVGISQGWRLSGAIGTAERALADGTLKHGGQPLMAWCVGNAKIEPKGNAKLITKAASGTGKIDPLMAGLNAVSLMAMNPQPVAVADVAAMIA